MSSAEALQRLQKSIDNASIFGNEVDAFTLAQELGFSIGKADMDKGDGFIAVDEEQPLPGFGTNKIIVVNNADNMRSKLRFIAQELILYASMKEKKPDGNVKFSLRNPLVVTDALIAQSKLLPMEKRNADPQKETRREFLTGILEGPLDEAVCQMDSMGVGAAQDWGTGRRVSAYAVSPETLAKENATEVVRDKIELGSGELMTREQKTRDKYISDLLLSYVMVSKEREEDKTKFRKRLFYGCGFASIAIIAVCLVLLISWIPIIFRQYNDRDAAVRNKIYAILDAAAGETDGEDPNDAGTDAGGTDAGQTGDQPDAAASGGASAGEELNTGGDTDDKDAAAIIAGLKELLTGTEFEPLLEPFVETVLDDGTAEAVTDISVRNVVSLITVCLTMLGSIFVLLKIIANNVFPQQEENRIQTLVQSIQKSDYDHRIALIKAKTGEAIGYPGAAPEEDKGSGK